METDRSPRITKERKQIMLTSQGRDTIQAYADANSTSFSAAIEMLALAGMETDTVQSVVPFVMNQLWRSVNSAFNRMAKLTASAAIEAGTTREISSILLLQHLNMLRYTHPDEYEEIWKVGRETPDDIKVRELQNKLKQIARTRSVRRLKKPLDDIDDILRGDDGVADHDA